MRCRAFVTGWVGLVLASVPPGFAAAPTAGDWPNPGNDKAGTRHSTLDQINRGNVKDLTVAWEYHTGDSSPGKTIECTPLVVDGVMYVTTVTAKLVALDAASGKEVWAFDPYEGRNPNPIRASGGVNRGVAFWSDGKPDGQRRVLHGVADGRLFSIDAKTGKPDPAFADNGELDLRAGIERDISKHAYGPTSPPAVFENTVVVGCSNDEGHPGAPGDPRAFDVRTGKELWRFHTIPRPGEFGYDTWEQPDAWKERPGANPWGGFTVDVENGIVFCGTGSAGPDFYGAGRKGANLFANCVLALDARTGKRLWHFQTTHHDVWDHDNPCPPVVVTVKHDGKDRQAVAQVTKTGFCWLLDRKTGEPLFGVKEVPATQSKVPGEQTHPTQPEPLKPPPLAKLVFTEDDATDISPEARQYVLEKLKTYRHGERYVPPSEQGSVITPGFHGGATWSGASFDPASGYLFVNTNNAPYISGLEQKAEGHFELAGYGYFNDGQGYPAIKPPWGLLTAVDLNTGEFAWQVPLGEFPELTAKGIPPTGTENFGGTIVTAGGLVFIGGTKDEKFRAFDSSTGKVLWDHKLPAGGYATPCTYSVKGRQYVCIAAGGGGKNKTKSGDSFVAFALPEADTGSAGAAPKADASPPKFDPTDAYETRDIDGWRVLVNKKFLRDEPDLSAAALTHLRHQLYPIPRVVPGKAVEKLRKIPIWVELDEPHHPCMAYHPDPGWLRDNGMNPDKARGVEVADARAFLTWTKDQPWMVLHELAHGYHHQFLDGGFDHAGVRAAYERAMREKRYDAVQRINGRTERAYAANNPMEFFAEATEALFGTNDFYPYVRAELKAHDPQTHEMLEKVWGVR